MLSRFRVREMIKHLPHPIIMDVGSGGAPFPMAHIIVDKYPGGHNKDRNTNCLGYSNQVFIKADVQNLPFDNGSVEFIWCSHVLEHVEDPLKAVAELCRVSPMGVILIPPVEAEGVAQIAEIDGAIESSVGHRWLCRKRPMDKVLAFLRCDTSNKSEAKGLLSKLGSWPMVPARLFEASIFQGWGWGGWPEGIEAVIEDPTDDTIAEWNAHFMAGNQECRS